MSDPVRVLIVEDDVTFQSRELKEILTKLGHEVVGVANNTEKAVRMAREENPDVIVMDIHLGDHAPQGGIEAALEISEIPDNHSKIVFLTNLSISEELYNEIIKLEKSRYVNILFKPPQEKSLGESIRLAQHAIQNDDFVFVSYSHADKEICDEMLDFLNQLPDLGIGVQVWADTQIIAGQAWRKEIELALKRANFAVVLISIDMVKSKFIREVELPILLKKAKDEGLTVIPVFLRSVPVALLQKLNLLEYQGLISPSEPLAGMERHEREHRAWTPLFDILSKAKKV